MSKNSYSRVGGENVRLLQALIDEAPSYTKPTNSRNANILKSIINNTEYNEPPQSEIEELLIALKAKIGGEIEVNELTVTENGTYDAGLNKAFNPVKVNVQPDLITKSITQNGTYQASSDNADGYSIVDVNVEGYKISEVSGLPSPIATFTDGAPLPMPKLKIAVEPIQEGSGDPSLTNIRPISGWSAVDVTVADDVDNPTTTKTITIQLGDTYYGGKLDVVSGVLTVDRAIVTFDGSSDETISEYSASSYRYRLRVSEYRAVAESVLDTKLICSKLKTYTKNNLASDSSILYGLSPSDASDAYIIVKANGITNLADFKTWLSQNELQVVYPLATPTTIQLTPTAVSSLLGQNNLWADTGDVIEASYFESL